MKNELAQETDSQEKLYTIGTVSRLTGVGAITLRAWERRYDLISPIRKESGHRLYTRKHIDQINRITSLTSQGMRISQIRPEMLEETAPSNDADGGQRNRWDNVQDLMIAAVENFDEVKLEEIYNEVLAIAPIEEVTNNVIMPILRRLGRRWKDGVGGIAEEHFFAFILRNHLGAQYHHRRRKEDGPQLLLACFPGELHEMALQIFALAAHNHGYRVLSLGASIPLEEIAYVARKNQSDAIVLSGSVRPDPDVIDQKLAALVSETEIPVFVGGQTSVTVCEAINKTGAVALGPDIATGLKRLAGHLNQT